MTNSIADLGQADVVFVVGSNTTEAHPVIGSELVRAARGGARLIVADPRAVRLTQDAAPWLPVRPGTNVALVNAMMRIILDEGLADEAFIAERTEGFAALRELLAAIDLADAAETCGVPLADIREAAVAYASAGRAAIVYSMGVTQHVSGTGQVRALADLAMLTGNVGRPGTGVNPLRGQNNVQGACDAGCLPDLLPGYKRVSDADARRRAEAAWGAPIPAEPGLTVVEMMDAAAAGSLKALYVMGENPVLSDPGQAHVLEALGALELLVVQDIFLTETAALADVVLPAATCLEKAGTFTNTERRVQLVAPVVDPPGEALPDGEIVMRLASAMGAPMPYGSPAEVMEEMATLASQYGGITHARLRAEGGLQWPCPDAEHPGTPILHAAGFARGRGAFAAVPYDPAGPPTTPERPFVLTTGRRLWNFHTETMTSRSAGLDALGDGPCVELNPADAAGLGVCDGDLVEVESAHGVVSVTARVGAPGSPRPGTMFMSFHHADAPANRLTGCGLDPVAKIPALKVTAVSVRRSEPAD